VEETGSIPWANKEYGYIGANPAPVTLAMVVPIASPEAPVFMSFIDDMKKKNNCVQIWI
jgi:hypothetical protein